MALDRGSHPRPLPALSRLAAPFLALSQALEGALVAGRERLVTDVTAECLKAAEQAKSLPRLYRKTGREVRGCER